MSTKQNFPNNSEGIIWPEIWMKNISFSSLGGACAYGQNGKLITLYSVTACSHWAYLQTTSRQQNKFKIHHVKNLTICSIYCLSIRVMDRFWDLSHSTVVICFMGWWQIEKGISGARRMNLSTDNDINIKDGPVS